MNPRHLIAPLALLALACDGTLESSKMPRPADMADEADLRGLDMSDAAPDQADLDADDTPDAVPDMLDAAPDLAPDMGPPLSPGCMEGAEPLAEGEHTFILDGRQRRFVVRLPAGYTRERPWPLVFALHGNGGDTSYWDATSGARNLRAALRGEAILIIAEAIEGNWRDYNQPAATWPARVESELAYFDDVLGQARDALCIQDEAVFAMGFSGGGSFAAVLGCRREDYRAIAVGGAVEYFDPAECIHHPAAWITIGAEELNSGREQLRDTLRDGAACTESSGPTPPSPPCIKYVGCPDDTPVHYCQHAGGHIWPDFGVSASWAFFKALIPPAP